MTHSLATAKLAAPAPPPPPALSRKQKAAIIVRFLLNEGAEVSLCDLPDHMQEDLTQAMANMRYVDRTTLASVVMEFAEELEEIGISFPNGIAGALNALDGRISPLTAARLRKEAGVRQAGDPWTLIRQQEVAVLLPMVEQESTEVAAVILSKLDVSRAAELLNAMPGQMARRITYAISLTGSVTPAAVDRIGLSLAAQLNNQPERAFDENPEQRIGAILNRSTSLTRDDVLEGLDESDQSLAKRVRDAIFTFANIPARITARDIPAIVREVEPSQLRMALAAAKDGPTATARDFILENISKRMSEQLREEIGELGKVRDKDGDTAMSAVVEAIRTLEAVGEIELVFAEDDEE